ncbi:MAG: 6-bladed beta-propeller, partial [Bacteroidetes bacterium]|nr:6-bladed beta-propeller [Bacteroidota bacterium]
MTLYKYVIYSLVLFILFSCNKTENERVGTVNVEDLYRTNDSSYSTVNLQKKFEKNTYDIQQEIGSFNGDSNYIFGEIKRIVTYKNNIFVLDTRDKQIKSYTLDGVWNGNFDLYGSGPGELLAPADLTIDELNEDLIVLGSQGKILKLDIDKKNLSLRDEIQVNNF